MALRKLVIEAELTVFKDAIAVVREAKSKDKVNVPGAYLMDAIRGRWKPSSDVITKDKKAVFKKWFDAAYKRGEVLFSHQEGDCIMISADNEIWTEWSAKT